MVDVIQPVDLCEWTDEQVMAALGVMDGDIHVLLKKLHAMCLKQGCYITEELDFSARRRKLNGGAPHAPVVEQPPAPPPPVTGVPVKKPVEEKVEVGFSVKSFANTLNESIKARVREAMLTEKPGQQHCLSWGMVMLAHSMQATIRGDQNDVQKFAYSFADDGLMEVVAEAFDRYTSCNDKRFAEHLLALQSLAAWCQHAKVFSGDRTKALAVLYIAYCFKTESADPSRAANDQRNGVNRPSKTLADSLPLVAERLRSFSAASVARAGSLFVGFLKYYVTTLAIGNRLSTDPSAAHVSTSPLAVDCVEIALTPRTEASRRGLSPIHLAEKELLQFKGALADGYLSFCADSEPIGLLFARPTCPSCSLPIPATGDGHFVSGLWGMYCSDCVAEYPADAVLASGRFREHEADALIDSWRRMLSPSTSPSSNGVPSVKSKMSPYPDIPVVAVKANSPSAQPAGKSSKNGHRKKGKN
ncbi:hypothetical protein DIPPA_07329 [Diplonema papillatum]|nr:hypothetical protein DIPPA_07329 [Diplonema papillatum]|eukprot:gene1007-1543_t